MKQVWTLYKATELDRHAQAWDALNVRCGDIPFLSSRFLLPLLETFGDGRQRLALCHDAGGDLQAAALLEPQGLGRWASFQPSQLPLGPWLSPAEANLEALLASLLRALPGPSLRLGLTQLDPLLQPRPAASAHGSSLDYIDTAWVEVQGSFDSYWEARGKNLRSNMRKQRNKLESDQIAMQFERITDPQGVDAALAEYGGLESAGWKAESGTAVHPDNEQGRFYARMMRAFCAAGMGEIWRLSFNGQAVAVDLCIRSADTLVILKTTFDASQRSLSPAFLLKQEAFQRIFDSGELRRIEFYGRLMEWHTRWSENSRRLYHYNLDRWSWLPRLHALLSARTGAGQHSATEATQE